MSVIPLYIAIRAELIQSGVSLEGWRVLISLEDAMELAQQYGEPIGGQYVYGATWEIDVTVPVGQVRVITKEKVDFGLPNR